MVPDNGKGEALKKDWPHEIYVDSDGKFKDALGDAGVIVVAPFGTDVIYQSKGAINCLEVQWAVASNMSNLCGSQHVLN